MMCERVKRAWVLLIFPLVGVNCGGDTPGGAPPSPRPPATAPDSLEPVDGDWTIFHSLSDPAHLNPVTYTEIPAQDVFGGFIFESMMEVDYETLEKKPFVAERWEISSDHLVYTFYLRKDVHFSDGVPLTAHDVKFSFDKIMDPAVDAASKRNYLVDVTSCETLDDYTLRFTCKQPYFGHLSSIGGLWIIPKHIYETGDDFNNHPNNRKPIGSGPYVFESWETGQRITLTRNEHYWGKKPHIMKRVFNIVPNMDAGFQILAREEMDFMEMTSELYSTRAQRPEFLQKFDNHRYYEAAFAYIGWNLRKPHFKDKGVRKALTMLLDRETIIQTILYGQPEQVTGYFYKFGPEYDNSLPPYPFDPARAKALLEEAGWVDSDGDGLRDKDGAAFRFELLFNSGVPQYEQLATVFQEELKRAGIEMRLRPLEWATFLDRIQKRNFESYIGAWLGAPFDQDPYQIWHSSQAENGSNYVGFVNAEVDGIIEQARLEFDVQKRARMYHQFNRIVYEEQPYTFLYTRPNFVAIHKRIHGVKDADLLGRDYRPWWVPLALQKYQ